MESAMLALLLVLAGVFVYLIFSPTSIIGPYLDKYCKDKQEKWTGEDVGESLIYKDQEGVPFVKTIDYKKGVMMRGQLLKDLVNEKDETLTENGVLLKQLAIRMKDEKYELTESDMKVLDASWMKIWKDRPHWMDGV